MVATIAYSLADLFRQSYVGGNIYLHDLKAWPDIMIITVFLIHSSFVATNRSFRLIQSHFCLDYIYIRENSLFDTRQMTRSFLGPQKIFIPYLTPSSTFIPYVTPLHFSSGHR